jgi:hypothetical protein
MNKLYRNILNVLENAQNEIICVTTHKYMMCRFFLIVTQVDDFIIESNLEVLPSPLMPFQKQLIYVHLCFNLFSRGLN